MALLSLSMKYPAAGGGGVPVAETSPGAYRGVEAVIEHRIPDALIVPTRSGSTARRIARSRPPVWITAVSREHATRQSLLFTYGVASVATDAYPDDWPPSPRSRFTIGRGTDSLVPTDNVSLQDLWCVYSDAAPENHVPPGRPQRIDIFQAVYAWDYPLSQDAFFVSYRVRNWNG